MDTRYHYLSIDSADDLSEVALTVALAPDEEGIDAAHVAAPALAADLDPPTEGLTRYWWRVLVGPDADLDPTGYPQPTILYWHIADNPEHLSGQWVIGDPEPDELPGLPTACWPVVIPSTAVAVFDALPADIQELAKAAAISSLRGLTAGIVGGCPVELRPCRPGCADTTWRTFPVAGAPGTPWAPALVRGQWLNIGCGHTTASSCGCKVGALRLPPPAGRVDEVWVDGVQLAASDYLLAGSDLYRVDGGSWPVEQDLSKPHTEAGTFAVVYLNSWPVDGLGALAAGLLAVEFGKGISGQKCRLPANTVQVARAGTTVQLDKARSSASAAFPDGVTGIPEVDSWVRLVNPLGHRVLPQVWSPDLPQGASTV